MVKKLVLLNTSSAIDRAVLEKMADFIGGNTLVLQMPPDEYTDKKPTVEVFTINE